MTTRTKSSSTTSPADEQPPADDQQPADGQAVDEPTAVEEPDGGLVRLDNPDDDGDPRYGIALGDGNVIPLPPAVRYELRTYPV